MVDFLANGLAIAELLADNAGGSAIDTDGDGGANKADEYVEIQNGSGNTVSLDGIEIWSQKNGLLFAFPDGETLAPGATATVVGEYTGTPPAGFYDAGNANNINFLPDGEGGLWDSIFLLDTTTAPPSYTVFSYGTPPRAPAPPGGFPSDAVQIGPGESINSSSPNGAGFSRDLNGDFVEGSPDPGTPDFLCIATGALIETVDGPVAIEHLRPGTRVFGHDGGAHELIAIGQTTHSAARLALLPGLCPVEVATGTLGATSPLRLSPNHCVLIETPLSDVLFSGPALVPAKALEHAALARAAPNGVDTRYFHLLFADHIVLKASGVWVESLYLGAMAQSWVRAQRQAGQLTERDAETTDRIAHPRKAYRALKAHEARLLIANIAQSHLGQAHRSEVNPTEHPLN
ncbi:MAG: Hint domain-containing protein [Pseudomonadota bacterium]